MRRALLLLAVAGCAQVLGLDNTKFDYKDAMIDAPDVCDGQPACVATTGRSVCGRLIDTGMAAGQPLRAMPPTANLCTMPAAADGPCALTVYAQDKAGYESGASAGHIAGVIDECGRFFIADVDPSIADVAVVFEGGPIMQSATFVLGRPAMIGTDTITAPVVRTITAQRWGQQMSASNPPDVSAGFVVRFLDPAGVPVQNVKARVNSVAPGGPPATPWAAYFTGLNPYDTLVPTAMTTLVSGTAAVIPSTGSFQLDGFRTGKTCQGATVQAVTGALIFVTLGC